MKLIPLASRGPGAVRDALVQRGMDESQAAAAASGLHPVILTVDDIAGAARDAVAESAHRCGLECLTGDGWVLLAGPTARVAGMVRADMEVLPATLIHQLGHYLSGRADQTDRWVMARGTVELREPAIVGILNVTPDSFSDGGRYITPGAALDHAEQMVRDGARMLDIGAESTGPGTTGAVSSEEEWHRLQPVIDRLVRQAPEVPISVDTVKSETARRALDAGAWAINDVSALRLDPGVADACAERGAGLVLMHSRGAFCEMASYAHARYTDVISEVAGELRLAAERSEERGVGRERLVLDPGLGFSKRPEHNFTLLNGLNDLVALGYPVMVGPSRKRFLGAVTGKAVAERDVATAVACVSAFSRGASLFRVHAVGSVRDALAIAAAVRNG